MRPKIVKITWFHPKMPLPQRVRLLFGSWSPSEFGDKISSLADLGCLSQILDPGSESFPSRIQDPGSKFFPSWIPDPRFEFFPSWSLDHGCISKNLSVLTKTNGFSALKNMIRVFHPGSGSQIWILSFYLSRIPILDPRSQIQGSKRHRIPDPRSGIATQEISGLLCTQKKFRNACYQVGFHTEDISTLAIQVL